MRSKGATRENPELGAEGQASRPTRMLVCLDSQSIMKGERETDEMAEGALRKGLTLPAGLLQQHPQSSVQALLTQDVKMWDRGPSSEGFVHQICNLSCVFLFLSHKEYF